MMLQLPPPPDPLGLPPSLTDADRLFMAVAILCLSVGLMMLLLPRKWARALIDLTFPFLRRR